MSQGEGPTAALWCEETFLWGEKTQGKLPLNTLWKSGRHGVCLRREGLKVFKNV